MDGNATYRCDCQDGFYGNHCDEEDDCYPSNQCMNGGICVDGHNTFSCNCPTGLTGTHCEREYKPELRPPWLRMRG